MPFEEMPVCGKATALTCKFLAFDGAAKKCKVEQSWRIGSCLVDLYISLHSKNGKSLN